MVQKSEALNQFPASGLSIREKIKGDRVESQQKENAQKGQNAFCFFHNKTTSFRDFSHYIFFPWGMQDEVYIYLLPCYNYSNTLKSVCRRAENTEEKPV